MIVRCKAFVANLVASEYNHTEVQLRLAYSQTPGSENYSFHAASPSGNIKLTVYLAEGKPNPALEFTPGSWWYVDTEKVDEILEVDAGSFAWLSGIDRDNGYCLREGKLERQVGNSLRAKCKGAYNGMNFESDIYIANDGVYDQFAEIGTLYKLSFTPTTKEGAK